MKPTFPAEIQQALALAEAEARRLNHAFVGTEHLLLAAIHDSTALAANVLHTLGVPVDRVRQEIDKLVSVGPTPPPPGQLPLTPRAQLAIEFACEEARFVQCDDCGGGLMLVGLAREPDGVAAQVFRNLGLTLQQIAGEVFKIRILQMKIVERCVRPIRCGGIRKRKMREELLAHLSEIYEEELAHWNDPRAATMEAARRFGNPAELAQELETSLPRYERRQYHFERWVGWRAPETVAKWMSRLAVQLFVFLIVVCSVGVAAAVIVGGREMLQWKDFRGGLAFVILSPLALCGLGILFYKIRDATFGVFGSRKSPARVLLLQVQTVLLILGCSVAYIAFAEWNVATVATSILPITVAAILLAATVRITVRFSGPTEIRDTYWACLNIDDTEIGPSRADAAFDS